jgi:hypothetical protein
LRSIAGERCACVSPCVYGGSESRFGRCAPRAGSPVARRALARDGDGSARSHRSLLQERVGCLRLFDSTEVSKKLGR